MTDTYSDMTPRQADRLRADSFFLVKAASVLIQRHDCTADDVEAAITQLERALDALNTYSEFKDISEES